MVLIVCTAVVVLLGYIIYQYFEKIIEYILWRVQLSKLPTITDWRFVTGNAHHIIGVPIEKHFQVTREFIKNAPPVSTLYLGPASVYVFVRGPDEIEATISSMKNLSKALEYDFFHDWLEDGLLTSKGEKWQKRRKILTPAFHFSILQQYVEIFTRETTNMVKEIEEKCLNKPVDILPIISSFTLFTINETSMGTKLDLKTTEGLAYKEAVYDIGSNLYKRVLRPWLHYKPLFDKTQLGKNVKKFISILHNFTNYIIQQRSANFKTFQEPIDGEDQFLSQKRKYPLLDILLNAKLKDNSIDEKGIREEVNTFMFGGFDTIAMSLSYTCMLLALHRDIQDEIYQEVTQILGTDLSKEPTYAHLQEMTFLERCIKESLRLYPPVSIVGRQLDSDVATQYGLIPKGTTCLIHIYDLHRNEKYFTNPEKFDPSRHLPENSRGRHPFAYIPFSAGPRNCIGQRFAMFEMKAVICGLIRKFILEPVDTPETLVLFQELLLRPMYGLKVKFALRN